MAYIEGGLGKNGQDIVAPIVTEMITPRTGLGYVVVVASFSTLYFLDLSLFVGSCSNIFKIISLELYPILLLYLRSRFPNDKSISFFLALRCT